MQIETEDVAMSTTWEKCVLPSIDCESEESFLRFLSFAHTCLLSLLDSDANTVDKEEYFDTIVHLKSLLQFLSSYVVSHTTIAGKSLRFVSSISSSSEEFTDVRQRHRLVRRPLPNHVRLYIRG